MSRKCLFPLILVAGLLSGCKSSGSESQVVMSNETCPLSGNAVDSSSYYEHEGTKIYTCCAKCVEKVAEDPDAAMAKAYGK